MDILEAISRRKSIRDYQPEPVQAAVLEEVRRSGEHAESLTRAELLFRLYSQEQMERQGTGVIGGLGKIIRAPHFIVLVTRENEGYLVDSGFRFEQMVLEATRRNLGTCWIGGMFKEDSLRSVFDLDGSWRIVALTPIGNPAKSDLKSRALRAAVRSSTRKPMEKIFFWQRHGTPLPSGLLADERLGRVLEATRRSPSWANKQPWRFILTGKEILLYKQMRQVKEGKDYHLVDCGIAMAHLHLAAKALGIGNQWKLGDFEIPGARDAEPVGRYPLKC